MIDINKQYKTRSGLEVDLHEIKLTNSIGKPVTYPVKGTILTNDKGRWGHRKTMFMIWSIDGITDIVWGHNKDLDLIEA
jgi:hypothetical protein